MSADCAWSRGGQGGARPDQGGATGENNLNINCQPIQQEDNLQEQERLRKEALLVAERERHKKYRRQDEEREVVRQRIRDKVPTNFDSK